MAATPPLQVVSSARTPPTPLHGPAHDHFNSPGPRYSTRSGQQRATRESRSTPEVGKLNSRSSLGQNSARRSSRSSTPSLPQLHSPQNSPKRKSSRRVQVISPTSPDFDSPVPSPAAASKANNSLLSATTIMADGMLPTPVKTPRKKNIPGVHAAARALFHEQPTLGEEVTSNSRRGRKGKRYNGFSLERFTAEDEGQRDQIHIFTDSRDNVPQPDTSEENPFVDRGANGEGSTVKKLTGTSKRRKLSGERKMDPQVEEAIKNDEGMVYVFRGKKIFRKFHDDEEEEEEIDEEDLGLLERNGSDLSAVKPLKTLTRKSIKPTRLFQTEQQKRAREAEKEEEAVTDIEDEESKDVVNLISPSTPTKKVQGDTPASPPLTGRTLRSTVKKDSVEDYEANVDGIDKARVKHQKKASPFDSWKRIKAGSSTMSSDVPKSRKRRASDVVHGDGETLGKKVKVQ